LTLSIEGNTLGKVVEKSSDVGRLVEEGTPIRITRRTVVRHMVIRPYYCGVQYKSRLKTER